MDRLIVVILFLLISCDKNSTVDRERNKNQGMYLKANTFISKPGIYHFRDIDIIIKEFKNGTIIYGITDIKNNVLYQRDINSTISNHMKWTVYIDNKDQIWFYNSDYQEINVFIRNGEVSTFIKNQNKLPQMPLELIKFINGG